MTIFQIQRWSLGAPTSTRDCHLQNPKTLIRRHLFWGHWRQCSDVFIDVVSNYTTTEFLLNWWKYSICNVFSLICNINKNINIFQMWHESWINFSRRQTGDSFLCRQGTQNVRIHGYLGFNFLENEEVSEAEMLSEILQIFFKKHWALHFNNRGTYKVPRRPPKKRSKSWKNIQNPQNNLK